MKCVVVTTLRGARAIGKTEYAVCLRPAPSIQGCPLYTVAACAVVAGGAGGALSKLCGALALAKEEPNAPRALALLVVHADALGGETPSGATDTAAQIKGAYTQVRFAHSVSAVRRLCARLPVLKFGAAVELRSFPRTAFGGAHGIVCAVSALRHAAVIAAHASEA